MEFINVLEYKSWLMLQLTISTTTNLLLNKTVCGCTNYLWWIINEFKKLSGKISLVLDSTYNEPLTDSEADAEATEWEFEFNVRCSNTLKTIFYIVDSHSLVGTPIQFTLETGLKLWLTELLKGVNWKDSLNPGYQLGLTKKLSLWGELTTTLAWTCNNYTPNNCAGL